MQSYVPLVALGAAGTLMDELTCAVPLLESCVTCCVERVWHSTRVKAKEDLTACPVLCRSCTLVAHSSKMLTSKGWGVQAI